MEKFEQAPGAESGDGGNVGGLADAQLSDVKSLGSSSMTDSTANAIGDSASFEFSNEQGHTFQTDESGNVSSFTYTDGNGNDVRSFTDIKRDDQGAVTGFTDSDGNVWTKQPADPTSPFPAEREGGGWLYKNEETGEEPRSAVELGDVTIDQNGVSASGQNADWLGIPED